LVQELIVSREKSKLEERALQQKAAYHERDAAQLRKRIESTQHHHEAERSAKSPSEDKAKLSSRLSASQVPDSVPP
jgi:predicted ATPase